MKTKNIILIMSILFITACTGEHKITLKDNTLTQTVGADPSTTPTPAPTVSPTPVSTPKPGPTVVVPKNGYCRTPIDVSSKLGSGRNLWVDQDSTHASDDNDCSDDNLNVCKTIQKGVFLLQPGDTLNIKSSSNPYVDDVTKYDPYVTKDFVQPVTCGWQSYAGAPNSASICVNRDGTKENPITIQAAPGHEHKVIINSEHKRVGIHLQNNNYIHVRGLVFKNNWNIGVASWGNPKDFNGVAQSPERNGDENSKISIGVVIENNIFENTAGPAGNNTSSIAMWGSKNWIVRNNKISGSRQNIYRTAGIQAYGVINALVEHNEISDVESGLFWKDHYNGDIMEPNKSIFESEIRCNKISATAKGVYFGIRGSGFKEGGHNYIHHNIISDFGTGDNAGIVVALAGATGQSGFTKIEHNLLDGKNHVANAIIADNSSSLEIKGNIITRVGSDVLLEDRNKPDRKVYLTYSDYNIFGNDFKIVVDRYSKDDDGKRIDKPYTSLSSWNLASNYDHHVSIVNNPDTNSIQADFTSLFSQGYYYDSQSPAIGFMQDRTNAGPYQHGDEIIGLLE